MAVKAIKPKRNGKLKDKLKLQQKVAKVRLNKRKILIELKAICSQKTKDRASGICEVCGKAGTQAHHQFSKKAFPHMAYILDNLVWMCYFCHIVRVHRQGQYELVRDAIIKRLGNEGFEALKNQAYMRYQGLVFKPSTQDLADLLESIKNPAEK